MIDRPNPVPSISGSSNLSPPSSPPAAYAQPRSPRPRRGTNAAAAPARFPIRNVFTTWPPSRLTPAYHEASNNPIAFPHESQNAIPPSPAVAAASRHGPRG